MNAYRKNLPQLGNRKFISDGGLETTMIFEEGFDLPEFAAFTLLESEKGRAALREYFLPYLALAREHGFGFILESPTWRASRKWGERLGYDEERLEQVNRLAIEQLSRLRQEYGDDETPIVVSGCIGPKGDGYLVEDKMTPSEAREYHSTQIWQLSETDADLISAFTINYSEEAIGITLAARDFEIPAVISFTLETDGRLPSGQPLGSAIREVDRVTGGGPAYYMINCAHPEHFQDVLQAEASWKERIRAVRANASKKCHAELEEAEELDSGDPRELAEESIALLSLLPNLNIFGGCCGTNFRHIEEIAAELAGCTIAAV